MARLSKSLDQLTKNYDAIIIGSGYGGGVAASRLARAGKRVAVLERGREFVTGEFPSRFPDLKNEMQLTSRNMKTGSATGLFDVRVGDDMHVLVGCGLGGGSLVNAGVALRPDARVFQDPVWPGEIRQDGSLDEGYKRAEAWLRPRAHARAAEMTKYKVLQAANEDLGHKMVAPRVVVSFEKNTSAGGLDQPACTLCGDCCSGCNVGAKNTVALTYLPDAVRHGAEIFTEIKVRTVRQNKDGGWIVTANPANLKNKNHKADDPPFEIGAPIVVLAAGTLGSTEILLRSAQAGLKMSPKLGRRFSANGDIIAFGYGATPQVDAVGVGHPPKIDDVEIGASVSGQIEVHDKETLDHQMCVQEGVLPSAIAPILPVMFVPNGRLLGALKSLINGVYKGPFAHLQTFFAVSHDSASGKFKLENDRLALSWPNADKEPVYQRLDAMLEKIVTRSGGSYVKNPLAGTVMGHQPATAHPLGGCTMGQDCSDGVVNHKGQVYDAGSGETATDVHRGLYVIDGAVIPRSLGVNPLLTITALSERAMIHMAHDYGMSIDADPKPLATPIPVTEPGLAASMP